MRASPKQVTGALLVALTASLAGCSSILTPLGSNTYDCNRKENPDSIYCHSFRAAEASTTGPLPPSRFDAVQSIDDYDRLTGIAPPKRSHPEPGPGSAPNLELPLLHHQEGQKPIPGTPVRVGPMVQRVWIKPFTDDGDRRIGATIVYREIQGTYWAGDRPGERSRQPRNAAGGAYPHYPAATGAREPAARPSEARAAPRTEFNQPTQSRVGAAELATPVPQEENGDSTMPK